MKAIPVYSETDKSKFEVGSTMLPDLVTGGFHLMKCTEFSEADTTGVTILQPAIALVFLFSVR